MRVEGGTIASVLLTPTGLWVVSDEGVISDLTEDQGQVLQLRRQVVDGFRNPLDAKQSSSSARRLSTGSLSSIEVTTACAVNMAEAWLGTSDGRLHVFDLMTCKRLAERKRHNQPIVAVTQVADFVASACSQAVVLWSAKHRTFDRLIACTSLGLASAITCAASSTTEPRLFCGAEDGTIAMANLSVSFSSPRTDVTTLSGHTDAVRQLKVEPTGDMLWSASADCTIKRWCTRTLVSVASVSTDGPVVALLVTKSLCVWSDVSTGMACAARDGPLDDVIDISANPTGDDPSAESCSAPAFLIGASSADCLFSVSHDGDVRSLDLHPAILHLQHDSPAGSERSPSPLPTMCDARPKGGECMSASAPGSESAGELEVVKSSLPPCGSAGTDTLDSLRRERDTLSKRLEEAEEKLAAPCPDCVFHREQLASSEALHKAVEVQLATRFEGEKHAAVSEVKRKVNDAEGAARKAEARVHEVQQEAAAASRRHSVMEEGLRAQLAALQNNLTSLQRDHDALTTQHRTSAKAQQAMEAQLSELEEVNMELSTDSRLEAVRSENEFLRRHLAKVTEESGREGRNAKGLAAQCCALDEEIDDLQAKNKELAAKVASLQAENDSLVQDVVDARTAASETAALRDSVSSLQRALRLKEATDVVQAKRIGELEKENEVIAPTTKKMCTIVTEAQNDFEMALASASADFNAVVARVGRRKAPPLKQQCDELIVSLCNARDVKTSGTRGVLSDLHTVLQRVGVCTAEPPAPPPRSLRQRSQSFVAGTQRSASAEPTRLGRQRAQSLSVAPSRSVEPFDREPLPVCTDVPVIVRPLNLKVL